MTERIAEEKREEESWVAELAEITEFSKEAEEKFKNYEEGREKLLQELKDRIQR